LIKGKENAYFRSFSLDDLPIMFFFYLSFFSCDKYQAHLECYLEQHLEVEVAVPLKLQALESPVLVRSSRVDVLPYQVIPMPFCSRCCSVKSATDWDYNIGMGRGQERIPFPILL
jgi:hypothetical protein